MNQIIKAGALVCALAMLEWNPAAVAEEKRLGDYIYVPAMSNPAGMGAISLRVDGRGPGPTPDAALARVNILRIDVESLTCRHKNGPRRKDKE